MHRIFQALLIMLALAAPASLTGCVAKRPDPAPTLRLMSKEFRRQAQLIRQGKLGALIGSAKDKAQLNAELIAVDEEKARNCDRLLGEEVPAK